MWQIVFLISGQIEFSQSIQSYYTGTLTWLLSRGGLYVLLRLACDYLGSDIIWLLRLCHKKPCSFHLVLLGHWPLEPYAPFRKSGVSILWGAPGHFQALWVAASTNHQKHDWKMRPDDSWPQKLNHLSPQVLLAEVPDVTAEQIVPTVSLPNSWHTESVSKIKRFL